MAFLTKFAQKRASPIENEKSEHHLWILHIRIRLATLTNLALNWQFWHFGPNFPKKGHFWSETKKTVNIDNLDQICPRRALPVKKEKSEQHHWIQHIQISLATKFQLQLTILTFSTKFAPKRVFPIKSKKTEHHHWILHIRISVRTKFQLKLIILAFWNKFAEKGHF